MKCFLLTIGLFFFLFCCIPYLVAQDVIINKASNTDLNAGPEGQRSYEMASQTETYQPLFSFDDVNGWEVKGYNAEGWLYRTQEQKHCRDYCGKLVYVGKGENPSLVAAPIKPILIPEPWDCVNFWNFGNRWGWQPAATHPFLKVTLLLKDANGRDFEIPMPRNVDMGATGSMDYISWFMMNGRLTPEQKQNIKRPVSFAGIRFSNASNKEKLAIYLGPISFYQEKLNPINYKPLQEKLPFPTRKETILPTNKTKKFENSIRKEGKTYVFEYKGEDCKIQYQYTPDSGTLSDIELNYNGKRIKPCSKSKLIFNAEEVNLPQTAVLKKEQMTDDTLEAVWLIQKGQTASEITYRLKILQKSMVIEMESAEPVVKEVLVGRAEGIQSPKLFKIPYLSFGGGLWYPTENDPHVLYADGLFFFNLFDWYYGDASEFKGGYKTGDNFAVYNGGAYYYPKTDGRLNKLRERLFINVSPDFQEVLPTIDNPPSVWGKVQGERLYQERGFGYPKNFDDEINNAVRLRNYGCDKVSVRYHEFTWSSDESFTFRLDSNPKMGGDTVLKKFVSDIQKLDWRVGLYTNYMDISPANKYFSEDAVVRSPDNSWLWGWMRCYVAKPAFAAEMEAKLAPQIQAKFGENFSYCDCLTAVAPWFRTDYDYRVPGTGTCRKTFESYGQILLNDKIAHKGPVFSEGGFHWFYAGFGDGNYGSMMGHKASDLLVDFDLLKIHPLETDVGTETRGMASAADEKSKYPDLFIASTIAYGHIGYLSWSNTEGMLKIYYMMQQLQKRYAMVPVESINYEDNGKLVDTSLALISGAYKNGRLRVIYQNGTTVYVNGSKENWMVQGPNSSKFELPQWGYLAWRNKENDNLLVYSAVVSSSGAKVDKELRQRADCSIGTDQYYLDSREGGFVSLGPIAGDGSAVLKKDKGDWYVIPATAFKEFAFLPSLVGLSENDGIEAIGVDENGSAVGSGQVKLSEGMVHVQPDSVNKNVFKYKIVTQKKIKGL